MLSYETMEAVFTFMFLAVMMIAFISWIVFARLTMARIERQIRRDGLPRPASWDGIGYRVLWYLHAIIFPIGIWNRLDDPLIDVALVRRYATRKDIVRGWVFFVSNTLLLLVGIVYALLFL